MAVHILLKTLMQRNGAGDWTLQSLKTYVSHNKNTHKSINWCCDNIW